MHGLDAPTVFRVGSPTLGIPVLALEYRAGPLPLAWWRRLLRQLLTPWRWIRAVWHASR